MSRQIIQTFIVPLIALTFLQSAVAENPLAKAREALRRKQAVDDEIDRRYESDRFGAKDSRMRIAERLDKLDLQVKSVSRILDKWKATVLTLLTNDAGRRLAGAPELRNGFVAVYRELNWQYEVARADGDAAAAFVVATRKFLGEIADKEPDYAPTVALQRRLIEVTRTLELHQRQFPAAIEKVELWLQITLENSEYEQTLESFLKQRPTDVRTVVAIGQDQIALRKYAYETIAPGFAALLTKESGQRQGTDLVSTLKAMSGQFESKRNNPDLLVTFRIDERGRNSFQGKMFLNSGDEVCTMSGRFEGNVFLCEIRRRSGRMTLKGTLKGKVVTGEWSSTGRGRDYGAFRISLIRSR